jgi:hypothetical protein
VRGAGKEANQKDDFPAHNSGKGTERKTWQEKEKIINVSVVTVLVLEGDRGGRYCGHAIALVEHHEGHLERKIDEGGKEQLSCRCGVSSLVEPVRHPQQIPARPSSDHPTC